METGTGSLLKTGHLKDYTPLGEEGNPVYKWATQIRVIIKRKINSESSNVFAIPQPNENGDVIDWYAPEGGPVIPWSSATPEEKIFANEQLEIIKQKLDVTGNELRRSDMTEQSIFNRLLDHVLQFPDEEHVYLVNGKPVLTFWGFVHTDSDSRPNPLSILAIPEPATAVDTISSHVETKEVLPVKRRSFWWWLLPLLLSLLLLLFLLRGCEKPVAVPLLEELIDDPQKQVPRDPKPDLIPGQREDRGINISNEAGVGNAAKPEDVIDNEAASPDLKAPSEQTQDEPPEQPASENEAAPEQEEPVPQSDETSGENQKQQEPIPAENDQAPNENPELKPLTIPDESTQKDSMDFLNGRWQANSGLMDKQGRPVNLEYEFKDGKGNVKIKKNDGSICSGAVEASRNGSELNFSDKESIKCQNGTSYQPAKVKCKINASKQTVCEGAYSSGDSFKMDINKSTETK